MRINIFDTPPAAGMAWLAADMNAYCKLSGLVAEADPEAGQLASQCAVENLAQGVDPPRALGVVHRVGTGAADDHALDPVEPGVVGPLGEDVMGA